MVTTIPYEKVQEILTRPMDERTRALIAFQYASGCRIGELLVYNHKNGQTTQGLLRENVHLETDTISWTMPNFKTKKKDKLIKEAFVYKQEEFLWNIIISWLSQCGQQVFEIKEARARQLVREQLAPYGSHVLRHSRGTHLVDKFGFSPWDIAETLGHTDLKSSMFYVSSSGRKKKMLNVLQPEKKEKEVALIDATKPVL